MGGKKPVKTVEKISRRVWAASAGDFWPDASKRSVVKMEAQTQFLISAILRQGVEGFTIELAHSSQFAGNADEATGIFTRRVLEQFPGYSLAKTRVTEISRPPEACVKDKQNQPAVAVAACHAVSAVMRRGATGFAFCC